MLHAHVLGIRDRNAAQSTRRRVPLAASEALWNAQIQNSYIGHCKLKCFVPTPDCLAILLQYQPPSNDNMELDIYWSLLLFLLMTILLLVSWTPALNLVRATRAKWQRRQERLSLYTDEKSENPTTSLLPDSETPSPSPPPPPPPSTEAHQVSSFRLTFLTIYILVMTPETLAGPYLWSLLRDDKGLPETTVVALFATAYASAAFSALGVGFLADMFGRRKACLVQCVFHMGACLTVAFGGRCLPVLFVGRVFAGVALTLLWTVFESWMVTEWNARGLEHEGEGRMSDMFGLMTLWNCACAILGGVVCHCMVSVLGSKMWPFGTAIVSHGKDSSPSPIHSSSQSL